jgi:transcription antitermination factor NusG
VGLGWAKPCVQEREAEMNATQTPVGPATAGPDWFAIQTRYRYEKKVAEQLDGKGVEVFLPLRKESRGWSDRQKLVTIPLFPGYAFVRLSASADSRLQVLRTAGFMGFVGFRGAPTAVPQKQIEDLRVLLKERVSFSLYPFVEAGQRVRIRGGCLHGLEGVLLKHDKDKLVISIASIQRSLAIQIRGYELELV